MRTPIAYGVAGGMVGALLVAGLTAASAPQVQEDSIKVYLEQLEAYIKSELSKDVKPARYQLQSFSIDRTHWHYMLDTATGELFRLEQGQSPQRSKWVSQAPPIPQFEASE